MNMARPARQGLGTGPQNDVRDGRLGGWALSAALSGVPAMKRREQKTVDCSGRDQVAAASSRPSHSHMFPLPISQPAHARISNCLRSGRAVRRAHQTTLCWHAGAAGSGAGLGPAHWAAAIMRTLGPSLMFDGGQLDSRSRSRSPLGGWAGASFGQDFRAGQRRGR
jgi:hypothetical protein